MDRFTEKHGSKSACHADKQSQDYHDITLGQALEKASERCKYVLNQYSAHN